MSDNELLLAISNIVSSQIEPLKQDIKSIKQDMQSTKQDIQSTKQDIQFTKILIENDILPRLQNIEACYTSTYNRYANGIEKLDADMIYFFGGGVSGDQTQVTDPYACMTSPLLTELSP